MPVSSVHTLSRALVRVLIAVFTAVVLLLGQSIFWNAGVSPLAQTTLVGVAVLSYFRPANGLLVLAGLAPLGVVGSRVLASEFRGAEGLVLAFLAGALVRGWTLHRFRDVSFSRLHVAVLLFGLVIAASFAEQIWFLQIQRDYPWPFAHDFLRHAGSDYLSSFRGYALIFDVMLLVEGLALLLYAAHYCRTRPQFAPGLVRMLAAGATAAALLNFEFFVNELLDTGAPSAWFVELFRNRRWSAHTGDLNAAGSFFALGMFIALGMGWKDRAHRPVWLVAGLLIGLAMWMTGSRTAIAAAVLVLGSVVTWQGFTMSANTRRLAAVVIPAAGILAVFGVLYFRSAFTGQSASDAATIRWLLLQATWRMLWWDPAFGVGVGQYALWSGHFAPPEFLNYYARENAHNNFAQVAGELGLAGLAAFVWMLGTVLWVRKPRDPELQKPIVLPVLAGVAAFMLTWLGGHPLLVPEVAVPYWLAMGVLAGVYPPADRVRTRPVILAVPAVAAVLVFSLPWRIEHKLTAIDLTRVDYGLSESRVMTGRARFFVPGDTDRLTLPLRVPGASENDPVEIHVLVDSVLATTISMSKPEWQTIHLTLERTFGQRVRQLDLETRGPVDRSVEVGDWSIIPRPHG